MKKFELNVVNFDNEDVIATSTVDVEFYVSQHTGHFHLLPAEGYDTFEGVGGADAAFKSNPPAILPLNESVTGLTPATCTQGGAYSSYEGYNIPGTPAPVSGTKITLSFDDETGEYTYIAD